MLGRAVNTCSTYSHWAHRYYSDGRFTITGEFGYDTDVFIKTVTVLGTGASNSTGVSRTKSLGISLNQAYEGTV